MNTAGLIAWIVGVLACSLAAPARSDALADAREAVRQIDRATICRLDPKTGDLRYVGATDDRALACFRRHGAATRLVVTSPGGDVLKAIEASALIAEADWQVVVVGLCASSCANYWVPAAESVEVRPYSAILLHGAPTNAWLSASDHTRRHRDFERRHRVGRAWFSNWSTLDMLWTARARGNRPRMTMADEAFMRLHVPHTPIVAFWQPRTEQQRCELLELLDGLLPMSIWTAPG